MGDDQRHPLSTETYLAFLGVAFADFFGAFFVSFFGLLPLLMLHSFHRATTNYKVASLFKTLEVSQLHLVIVVTCVKISATIQKFLVARTGIEPIAL